MHGDISRFDLRYVTPLVSRRRHSHHTCSHSDFKSGISRQIGAFFVRLGQTESHTVRVPLFCRGTAEHGTEGKREEVGWGGVVRVAWVLVRCCYGNTKECRKARTFNGIVLPRSHALLYTSTAHYHFLSHSHQVVSTLSYRTVADFTKV